MNDLEFLSTDELSRIVVDLLIQLKGHNNIKVDDVFYTDHPKTPYLIGIYSVEFTILIMTSLVITNIFLKLFLNSKELYLC